MVNSKDKIYKPETIEDKKFPKLNIANEVRSPSFDSIKRNILGNFTFAESGALKISVKGYSAYIKLSPAGIYGNNGSYDTFGIDATTGNAFFKGAISASTIDIGGADTTSFHVDIDGNIWSGGATFASGLFKVSNAGVLTLSGASSSISIGSGNSIFIASSNGIQLGHATFASAPFRVTPAGALTATNVDISSSTSATKIALESGDYLSFYAEGVLKGRLRGSTAGVGGIVNVGGDFAVENNHTYLAKGTGNDYARFGVTDSNATILVSATDTIYFKKIDDTNLMTVSRISDGGGDYNNLNLAQGELQLFEKEEQLAAPSNGSCQIYVNTSGELKVTFRHGGASSTKVIATA